MKSLSWKPKRRGSIYCAPACGGGCTYSAYLAARKKARDIVAELGPGWKPDVWENIGWHCGAVDAFGLLKVYPQSSCGGYNAYLSRESGPGGNWAADGRTPREAVNNVVRRARRELAALVTLLGKMKVWGR